MKLSACHLLTNKIRVTKAASLYISHLCKSLQNWKLYKGFQSKQNTSACLKCFIVGIFSLSRLMIQWNKMHKTLSLSKFHLGKIHFTLLFLHTDGAKMCWITLLFNFII